MKGHNYQNNVQHVTESTKKCSFTEKTHVLYLRKALHFSSPNICSEFTKLFWEYTVRKKEQTNLHLEPHDHQLITCRFM